MLYNIIKVLAAIFYRIYYRIAIVGKQHIPYNRPLVIAPNHTNAFVDPTAFGMNIRNKVRFFARGDVFKGHLAKWALNQLNISPMYRMQDGYGELKKNDKAFEECRNLLSDNKTIMIYPEAICIQEMRLQPLKKGLTRIVFQTEEFFDFKKNVLVVPVGMNYSKAAKFGSRLFIAIGNPISIKNYEETYKQDRVRAINEFTKYLEREMTKLIITVDNKENDKLVEGLLDISLYDWMQEKGTDTNDVESQYHASKEIVEMINFIDKEKPALLETLKSEVKIYTKQLHKLNLRDHLLRPEAINKMNFGQFFIEFLIIWLGMPFYAIGWLTNALPYIAARNFADEKVKKVEFYASFYLNMSMLLWVGYYGIQLLIVAFVYRNWYVLAAFALLVPVTGLYTLWYYPAMKKAFGRLRLLRMVRQQKKKVEQLIQQRMQIISDIAYAKKEYYSAKQAVNINT